MKTVLLGITILLFGIALIIESIGTVTGPGLGLGTALFGLVISVVGKFISADK